MHKGKLFPNSYNCWTCDFNGANLFTLFKRIGANREQINQLKELLPSNYQFQEKPKPALFLPDEFRSLTDYNLLTTTERNFADVVIKYLKSRNVTKNQIYRFGLGFAVTGNYAYRLIIPSYDKFNNLNYFLARKVNDELVNVTTYLGPQDVSKDVIIFENTLDFSQPVRLVEGVFDVFASRYNTTPLLGLNISESLDYELIMGKAKELYFMLDQDAIAASVKYLNHYKSYGKKVFFVPLKGKDPSNLGFTETNKQVLESVPYDFRQEMMLTARKNNQIRVPYL